MKNNIYNLEIYNLKKRRLLLSQNEFGFNNQYGVAGSLLKFIGETGNVCLTCPIEHGLTITNKYVTANEHTNSSNYIITNSTYNEKRINNISDKQVIKIGPYIEYAQKIYSDKIFTEEKEKNGRTLLVFPTHGIEGYSPRFDEKNFIDKIEDIRKDFDTVIACMYFYDIICNHHKVYMKKGYKIASAGNAAHMDFLSRLRYIIELSDAVISNGYTTGLQYAIYLEKPVYIHNLDVEWENTSFNNVDKFDDDLIDSDNMKRFYELCNDPQFGKLKEQRIWGEYMFGINLVRTPDELSEMLKPVIRKY